MMVCHRHLFLLLIILVLIILEPAALGQQQVAITGTKNIRLSGPAYEVVRMGGVKDNLKCDTDQSIFMPANRGYSDEYGSVVRIAADGKKFRVFSLDGLPGLSSGNVEDFDITADGRVSILARQVAKGANSRRPAKLGTYVLRFGADGNLEKQTRLVATFGDAGPTGLAVLESGELLVAGYSYSSDNKKVRLVAYLFSDQGSLKTTKVLTGEGTQAANSDSVGSMSVIHPMLVRSGGSIFLMRGSTRDPIFVFSGNGELLRTITLQAPNLEFSSPKIDGNRLVVHELKLARKSNWISLPESEVFPVFDLRSGALLQHFEWLHEGELACFNRDELTFLH